MTRIVWGGGTERNSEAARALRGAARCAFLALAGDIAANALLLADVRKNIDARADAVLLLPALEFHLILLVVAIAKTVRHYSTAPAGEKTRALVWIGAAALALLGYVDL